MPNNSNNYNLCPLNFLNGKDLLNNFINNINETNDKYMIDNIFLYRYVYPCVINNTFVHASHNKYEPFAKDFPVVDYNGFVGEILTKVPYASKIFGETCDDFERLGEY